MLIYVVLCSLFFEYIGCVVILLVPLVSRICGRVGLLCLCLLWVVLFLVMFCLEDRCLFGVLLLLQV